MNITAAAMSQQIRQLEERLEVSLFHRLHRSIELTHEGLLLQPIAQQAFELLNRAIDQVGTDPEPKSLAISVLPSFGQTWLVSRLGEFNQQNRDLSVYLMASDNLADFSQERLDLCIRFGLGRYDGLESKLLMPDHLYPVAHPDYLKSQGIRGLEDLHKATLIEDQRPDMNWKRWLANVGITAKLPAPAIRYAGAQVVLEGALSGQGVALVRHSLAYKALSQGLISSIGDYEVQSNYRYYLVAPEVYFKREKVQRFEKWVSKAADEFYQQSQELMPQHRIKLSTD